MTIYTTISINADEVTADENEVHVNDLGGLHVPLAGEARTNGDTDTGREWECVNCDSALINANDGHGEAAPLWLSDDDEEAACPCAPYGEPGGINGDHVPAVVPLSWANSVSVEFDDSVADAVTVMISVGDPRGAFAMRVERARYTNDDGTEVDELRLSVPHPTDDMGHMPLTEINERGYYRIGG